MKLKKIGVLIIPIIVGFSTMGCDIVYEKVIDSVYGEADMDGNRLNEYEKFALEDLKRKYGEEFVIVQRGGTHGAYRKTKKFLAAPKANENIPFTLEVDYEKTETIDDYINIIMEQKFEKLIEKDVKEVFGEDVNIKAAMSGELKKYDSIEMDAIEFINLNKTYGMGITIFIKTNEDIDKEKENKRVDEYLKRFEKLELENSGHIIFAYTKEKFFDEINTNYYQARLTTEDLLFSDEKNYNTKFIKYKDGKTENHLNFRE
ncbi:MAG: hypothetical protein ACRDDY_16085 [Clostridium sp.]|uniref:hypothetical protein n=1 Tax=Clostridium sp. TaxID=1506 RepID=UPI003EE77D7C